MSEHLQTLEEWRSRAVALMHAGERGGQAVIASNAAILDLDRSDDAARTRLGFAYRLGGDFDSAEAVYRQILESSPSGSANFQTAERALTRIERERAGGVVSSLEAQLAAVVNADDAYQRASALRDEGQKGGSDAGRLLATALRWVDRGLWLAERQGRAKLRRGLAVRASIKRAQGRPKLALADARASVALGLGYEDNSSAFVCLTACLMDLEETNEAVDIAAAHLESDRGNKYAMNAAGRAFLGGSLNTGEVELVERGERCFRRAVELGPNPSARAQLIKLAQQYRAMNRLDRAEDLERFLTEIAP